MYDFQEHMREAKEAAAWQRSRGIGGGTVQLVSSAVVDAQFDRDYPTQAERLAYIAECERAYESEPEGANPPARACEAQHTPARTCGNPRKRGEAMAKRFDSPMTGRQYRNAAAKLELTIVGMGRELGIGWRQSQRYAADETVIPQPIAKLIRIWIAHPETRDFDA